MNKLEIIKLWAINKDWFDTTYIDDLLKQNGKLTLLQEVGVNNIYYKFKIDKFVNNL